jgi:glutathione S-transferase
VGIERHRPLSASRYGEGTLYSSDLQQRASADKWMDWTTSSLAGPFRDVFWNTVRLPPAERNSVEIERGLAACSRLLAIANGALSGQPFLSGQQFGMGDIPLGSVAYAWFEMPIERPTLPHLEAWYERLAARPAYRKAVMIPLT